jgi:hypothetical protein
MRDQKKAGLIMKDISEFTELMNLSSYASKKKRIETLYERIRQYIIINLRATIVGRYLFVKGKLQAAGRSDWDGFVDLKREEFRSEQLKFTGKVLKTVNADVQCFVEVESIGTLKRFNTDILRSRFKDKIVIDGNDPRGIDIALGCKKGFEIVTAKTNIFATDAGGTIFSRDCLEVELTTPSGKTIYVLVNHFKAKDRTPKKSDAKRKRQSAEVSRILQSRYNLKKDLVIVAGDLNDEPDSDPISPLIKTPDLLNVLDLAKIPEDDRWTYYYGVKKSYNSIDYMFVSKPLKQFFKGAGLERRGMYNVEALTNGKQKPFKGIDNWRLAASDHAAIYADFDL